jgi:hypothetical protein
MSSSNKQPTERGKESRSQSANQPLTKGSSGRDKQDDRQRNLAVHDYWHSKWAQFQAEEEKELLRIETAKARMARREGAPVIGRRFAAVTKGFVDEETTAWAKVQFPDWNSSKDTVKKLRLEQRERLVELASKSNEKPGPKPLLSDQLRSAVLNDIAAMQLRNECPYEADVRKLVKSRHLFVFHVVDACGYLFLQQCVNHMDTDYFHFIKSGSPPSS